MDQDARVRAPDFTGAVDWLNVPAPLSLRDLRGKVVLLDFWTYGCINCMHLLPVLRRLEEKHGDALVVVGVHSAKFTNERASDNLRRILVRYDIEHPVANDANHAIANAYGARAWPSLVLIDPEGYVVGAASGEGHGEAFDRAIEAVIQVFDERGAIDRTPLPRGSGADPTPGGALCFPGKVAVDEPSGRLAIADSNHHRILVAGLDGVVQDEIGSGRVGQDDGPFAAATFYRPQGLAFEGDRLYVADTVNHLVRAVDLAQRTVTTLAGTGRQGGRGSRGGAARETSLSSPWDVALHGRLLIIAMAGLHQVWLLDLERRIVIRYAGSGVEARVDGAIDDAAFAQPSGLAVDGQTLFVADSESNAIRAVALPPENVVRTVAGGDLFEFGDEDGQGDTVRLQHPLGLAAAAGSVFIADTYNHRVKRLDPATGRVTSLAGDGGSGAADGPAARARFHEPGGIAATSDRLYVADTNNHAIRGIRLDDGVVETLRLDG